MTTSQILRIAQKISFVQKMSCRSIPIYPENLTTFEEGWSFAALSGRPNVIWNFAPIILLAHCASFISRWPLLRKGGEVCRSVVGTGPIFLPTNSNINKTSIYPNVNCIYVVKCHPIRYLVYFLRTKVLDKMAFESNWKEYIYVNFWFTAIHVKFITYVLWDRGLQCT